MWHSPATLLDGPAGYRLGLLPGRVVIYGTARQGSDVARISATLPGGSGGYRPIVLLDYPARQVKRGTGVGSYNLRRLLSRARGGLYHVQEGLELR